MRSKENEGYTTAVACPARYGGAPEGPTAIQSHRSNPELAASVRVPAARRRRRSSSTKAAAKHQGPLEPNRDSRRLLPRHRHIQRSYRAAAATNSLSCNWVFSSAIQRTRYYRPVVSSEQLYYTIHPVMYQSGEKKKSRTFRRERSA